VPRQTSGDEAVPRDGFGQVPTHFAIQGPQKVPRVDYERIFVLDEEMKLLGEYALRDDCPLEYHDLRRLIPVSGLRHLVSVYQGEYAFTPFRVERLWLVVLTHGVPRLEERGAIGTLLAAMQAHLPASLLPALAEKEAALRELERDIERRGAGNARGGAGGERRRDDGPGPRARGGGPRTGNAGRRPPGLCGRVSAGVPDGEQEAGRFRWPGRESAAGRVRPASVTAASHSR